MAFIIQNLYSYRPNYTDINLNLLDIANIMIPRFITNNNDNIDNNNTNTNTSINTNSSIMNTDIYTNTNTDTNTNTNTNTDIYTYTYTYTYKGITDNITMLAENKMLDNTNIPYFNTYLYIALSIFVIYYITKFIFYITNSYIINNNTYNYTYSLQELITYNNTKREINLSDNKEYCVLLRVKLNAPHDINNDNDISSGNYNGNGNGNGDSYSDMSVSNEMVYMLININRNLYDKECKEYINQIPYNDYKLILHNNISCIIIKNIKQINAIMPHQYIITDFIIEAITEHDNKYTYSNFTEFYNGIRKEKQNETKYNINNYKIINVPNVNNINNRNCIYGLILKPSKKAYNMFMDVYNNNIFNRQYLIFHRIHQHTYKE